MNRLFKVLGFLVLKGKELGNNAVWPLLVGERAHLIGGGISLRKGELRAS